MTSWIRRFEVAFLLLVLAFTTASCGVSATSGGLVKQAAEAAEASPTETSTATPLPTATSSPTPTPLPPPTATATPAPTSTFTPVPSPLDTPTPPPPPTVTYPPPPEEVRVPILMYHYVSELPPDADTYRRDLTVSPATFEAHLRYLQAQGYQSVSLADVYATLTIGKPLPERPIVLTFDDGYKDAYTHALPLLTQYGFQGEFFVLATPAHYEAAQYLTWDEMRVMAEAGMSMQAHGRDHFDLTGRDYEFLVYQILGAREAVEAHTGQPVRFFCYPSGRYDEDAMAVVEAAGYWGAVTTEWGTALRLDNRFAWPRIRVRGNWDADALAGVLEGLH